MQSNHGETFDRVAGLVGTCELKLDGIRSILSQSSFKLRNYGTSMDIVEMGHLLVITNE
jgi:hypothetical protein